jgi:hypothetical protein
MLPMTIRCAACGAYLGRGKKFNARKEDAVEERYLGVIQVCRFYIRCPLCAAEIALKTDPASAGYAVESGATSCRDGGERQEEEAAAREDRACRAGARWTQTRRWRRRGRSAPGAPEQLLEPLSREAREELEQAADEELVKSVTFRTSTAHRVKRIDEGKDEDFFEACLAEAVAQAQKQERATIATKSRHVTPVAADARRTAVSVTPKGRALVGEGKASLQALCCSYGDGIDQDVS